MGVKLYCPGPGIVLSIGGASFKYTLEYASLAIPKLLALEVGLLEKPDFNTYNEGAGVVAIYKLSI